MLKGLLRVALMQERGLRRRTLQAGDVGRRKRLTLQEPLNLLEEASPGGGNENQGRLKGVQKITVCRGIESLLLIQKQHADLWLSWQGKGMSRDEGSKVEPEKRTRDIPGMPPLRAGVSTPHRRPKIGRKQIAPRQRGDPKDRGDVTRQRDNHVQLDLDPALPGRNVKKK